MMHDLTGTRLGNYQVERQLGHGGMAYVYKALDTTLKRPVAIKVVAPGLNVQDRYRERFEREAQSIAALDHPHIVPVHYFGQEQSLYYLVMKFIEGETLETLMHRYGIAGEYLPASDILRIVDGVAAALDYAHRRGVIHRDVKPSNVMVDSQGHPWLTDFGLALNVQQGSMGEVFGTPHYISPEQATNSSSAVPQSDIYSLGVVLYELFTGVVPFDDPSPTAVALQHVTQPPIPPRALNEALSPAVEAVILRALAKKPDQRYPTTIELADALRTALQNAGKPDERMEIPALPPLPPGFHAPPPRQVSLRSMSGEVRASLAQRHAVEAEITRRQNTLSLPTQEHIAATTQGHAAPATQRHVATTTQHAPAAAPLTPAGGNPFLLPLLLFGGVLVAVVVMVLIVASTLNPPAAMPTSAALPATPTAGVPENTAVPPTGTNTLPADTAMPAPTTEPQVVIPPTTAPTATPEVPASTSVPPTNTPAQPTSPPEPPTNTPDAGPTNAPANWVPVHFVYDNTTFWWVNDSQFRLSVNQIYFARADGSNPFSGSRWAQFYARIEGASCVRLTAYNAEVRMSRPAGCNRTNSDLYSNSQEVFWTGDGQFYVYWNESLIGVCQSAAGQCSLALPPD